MVNTLQEHKLLDINSLVNNPFLWKENLVNNSKAKKYQINDNYNSMLFLKKERMKKVMKYLFIIFYLFKYLGSLVFPNK